MTKKCGLLAMVLLLTLCTGCSKGYVQKDGKWFYRNWNESWAVYYEELNGVDSATFVIRKDGLGSDKNVIWYEATRITVDLATFKYIGGPFYTDKHHVFYRGAGFRVVKAAEPKSWRSQDRTKTPPVDPGSFQYLRGEYGKDMNSVFFQWESIPKADVLTFTPTSDWYATDKNNVWYRDLLISEPRVFPKKTIRSVDIYSFKDLQKGKALDKYGAIEFGGPVD